MRYFITISYNGTSYAGLQVQKSTSNTIMGMLYKALKASNINSKLVASGRTDAGVHAFRQTLHFDVDYTIETSKLKDILQRKLPSSIFIRSLKKVDQEMHARYSAKKRVYRYILQETLPSVFENDFVTYHKNLDINILKEAIKVFEGEHSFENFRKTGSDTGSFVRNIYKTKVYRYRSKTILYFEANGFLRSQIRLMVAFLLLVNDKVFNIEDLKQQLLYSKLYNNNPAPHQGLYLSNIIY